VPTPAPPPSAALPRRSRVLLVLGEGFSARYVLGVAVTAVGVAIILTT
jgi:hypothetical protein